MPMDDGWIGIMELGDRVEWLTICAIGLWRLGLQILVGCHITFITFKGPTRGFVSSPTPCRLQPPSSLPYTCILHLKSMEGL